MEKFGYLRPEVMHTLTGFFREAPEFINCVGCVDANVSINMSFLVIPSIVSSQPYWPNENAANR